ncbi:unnamed protein product [Spodoptera exigua]|nr:unnamed protein product [Spodoptera exigua]
MNTVSLSLSTESDGLHDLPLMERVAAFLVIFSTNFAIQSYPIENGFSVKYNPNYPKEDLRVKKPVAIFGKNPQEFKQQEYGRRETVTEAPDKQDDMATGYSNLLAKLMFPRRLIYTTDSKNSSHKLLNEVDLFNLPVVRQPYANYTVIVAAAPPNMHLDGDNKRTIIYIVFPDNGSSDSGKYSIPAVYFVKERSGKNRREKKELAEPIIIIDSNRTVTGIKSKEISKYLKFNNKWTSRNSYKVDR